MNSDNHRDTRPTEPGPSPRQQRDALFRRVADYLFDIVELFVFCATVILLIFTFVARPTVVKGPSMENTLHEGDYLIVRDLGYTAQQGDIIVVHNPGNKLYNEPIIKRVIATAGQVIDIDFSTWTVTVDGVVLDEPYRHLIGVPRTSDFTYPMTIPEGYIFVMGDNRNHSADSRSQEIGLIDERCIIGKAIIRVLPFNRITLFD